MFINRKELLTHLDIEYFLEMGEYYGYPKCCINFFVSGEEFSENQVAVSEFKGFIPCPECTQKVLHGEIALSDLITNRKEPEPFL